MNMYLYCLGDLRKLEPLLLPLIEAFVYAFFLLCSFYRCVVPGKEIVL